MDQPVGCRKSWDHARRIGRWGVAAVLLVVWALILADHAYVVAAEQPSKGGTIIWAVHEGMPDFDIHYQTEPISPHNPWARSTTAC